MLQYIKELAHNCIYFQVVLLLALSIQNGFVRVEMNHGELLI